MTKKVKGVSQTTGKDEALERGSIRVGAVPTPEGVRRAGCKKLLGSPHMTLCIQSKKGEAQKRDLRSLLQAGPCCTATEVRASTGFAV